MSDQEKKLEQFFNEWKNSMEQVDDVLVIGIRVWYSTIEILLHDQKFIAEIYIQ